MHSRLFGMGLALALVGCGQDASPGAGSGSASGTATARPLPDYRNTRRSTPPADGLALLSRDAVTGDLLAAAVSRTPLAAGMVLRTRAGVGAAAAQGNTGGQCADAVLDALAAGADAASAVQAVVEAMPRPRRARISLAAIDASGRIGQHCATTPNSAIHAATDLVVMAYDCKAWDALDSVAAAYSSPTTPAPHLDRAFRVLEAGVRTGDLASTRPPRSAALQIARQDGGPHGRGDQLVDARVDFDGAPLERLSGVLTAALRAQVAPRLEELQRSLDGKGDPVYDSNSAWLKRIRRRVPIGQ